MALHLFLLVAFAAFVFLAVGPRTGQYRTLTVLSGSMAPEYPKGSLVIDTPQRVEKVRPGDVLTFHAPTDDRRVVTHRVVRVLDDPAGTTQPVVETKGDANPDVDPWQARLEGDTAWRARIAIPYLGYALMFLHRAGRGLWLVFPMLFAGVCLLEIWAGAGRTSRKGHVAVAR